ncbi:MULTISPECIES: dihydroneopterin triphosphate 2'-epimerase [unclassified Thalassotalea]|uniref:dihydroneopterin triphosphate 2'-epimerase n=1 Tax=unclassified Thalassotalea TaxID=2614972 RepID=UPI001081065D|nr:MULTISPECIES: dihydroneopterin triphosphate 2'-epimerase [unclassified Thalassotalea]NMP15077.1 dihydroneopterin triphosphate 2'-epimerase [Thalassotalea sp. Y01]QBY03648.1 dihydroneopterin triphosphate 2'-epimerase [Thalassotalea sp. HSM 43]
MENVSKLSEINSQSQLQLDDATIDIINLRLRTFIGFNPDELTKQQDIVINAQIKYPAVDACQTDEETQALNYKTITKAMIHHVEDGHFKLLEKLTKDLLEICMEHKQVNFAKVTVEKPHALRFADSVSLTLSASRK